MSGPTNRRFVRSAWTLLAFQFVAAAGAVALSVWAATRVQALIDQRDQLQSRVTQLEARPAPPQPPADAVPVIAETISAEAPVQMPAASTPTPQSDRAPVTGRDGSGVIVHRPPPRQSTVIAATPLEPPLTYVPPRRPPAVDKPPEPTVTYVPPREPPMTDVPPRRPPIRYPPREPPVTYVPPRQPPVVRPTFPTRPTPTPQQPIPGTNVRPTRPGGTTPPTRQPAPGAIVRPVRPPAATTTRPPAATTIRPTVTRPQAAAPVAIRPTTNAQPTDPRRVRRPRTTDTEPQPEPPK